MTWPTRSQQIGLVIVLAILAIVALMRAAAT
jgi:preprotein translocase subunit SecE